MLSVVDDARVDAGDGHAAWSESFSEMFMQVAGSFSNARVRRHGRAYVLGLLSHAVAARASRPGGPPPASGNDRAVPAEKGA
jgi:hypothetical protein